MSQARIRQLLESRLATWAAAQSPAVAVAWDNKGFNPSAALHLRAALLPAPTASDDLKGRSRTYLGVFQVTVVAPKGGGAGAAEAVAQSLAELFPVNLLLTIPSPAFAVQIITPMSPAAPLPEPDRYAIPVSAQYRADT